MENHRNPWTNDELDFIIENHGRMTNRTMANHLGRSINGISQKIALFRKAGIIEDDRVPHPKASAVSAPQMVANREAVESETLFLLGFGDYPKQYQWRVINGLRKALKERTDQWFWERREWKLSTWLGYFHA